MRFKTVLTICAAVAMLAACSSEPEANKAATGTGTTAPMTTGQQITPGSQQDLVANVGDRIFFDFDKSNLRPDARAQVEKWAAWLKKYPQNTVTIAGNCDERGTREYNLALGERRAAAAKKYLIALGIDAKRIGTISYGKERPSVVGSNEAAWAQNRNDIMTVN
ncbi:MAG TPA: peptidoglycan-associated lipoprotein Pal [Alphaproteobacteria bacterium]|nr:peptidoglycan-associated lipoprotein Pal [Alphaproteobacteria bacterium]